MKTKARKPKAAIATTGWACVSETGRITRVDVAKWRGPAERMCLPGERLVRVRIVPVKRGTQ